jgi:hypothetical protein
MSGLKEFKLKDAVTRAILNKEKWDRSSFIGASEIADCPLKIYFNKIGKSNFKGNGKTERGRALEIALISLLKKGGIDIRHHDGHVNHQKEIKHPDFPVIVHPDGIIYKENKPYAVLEVKSVGSEYFRKINEPLNSWVVQARFNAYMAGLKKAVLVAVNASDLEDVKEWEFEAIDEAEALKLLEKAKKIITAVEMGIEPFAEPSADRCKWCEFKNECSNVWVPDEEAKEKEIETDEIKDALEKLKKAKELKDEAKELETEAKAEILNTAKKYDASKLASGDLIAIVETRKSRITIDTKKLFAEHPEIDKSKYEKTGKPVIAIKLKERK